LPALRFWAADLDTRREGEAQMQGGRREGQQVVVVVVVVG
jgi:hypothetical protein